MPQKVFFIEGEDIFDAGFRISLYAKAKENDIKINATNLRKERKIRVIVAGDIQNIEEFHSLSKNEDIRSITQPQIKMYNVRPIKNYKGPKIDWNGEELGLISIQISKILDVASAKLNSIDTNINSINTKIEQVDKKFGVIGETLSNIDRKIPEDFTPTSRENESERT